MKINERTLDSIKNNYLFFSHPKDFTDPFDSCINEEVSVLNSPNSIGTNRKVYQRLVKPETLLICCFSESGNSILMWSHYAEGHKGMCLIFNAITDGKALRIRFEDPNLKSLPPGNKDSLPAFKVNYRSNMPPPYDKLKDENTPDAIWKFLEQKYLSWAYEEERRIIIPESDVNTQRIKFKKDSLAGIIFGMDTSVSDEQRVQTIVQEHYKGVPIVFFKSKPITGKYAVDIDPL